MKVIGFTSWNERHKVDRSEEARLAVIEYLKENKLAYGGVFHQQKYGVPMLDNKKVYAVSMRDWGQLIADMIDDRDKMAYCKYAWEYSLASLGSIPSHFEQKIYDAIDAYRMGYMDVEENKHKPKRKNFDRFRDLGPNAAREAFILECKSPKMFEVWLWEDAPDEV